MATYAILRTQKLKSAVAVHRSMKHAFREQDTPNADAQRTPDNSHIGASDVKEAMAAFRSRLPEKHRKDAVLAIEYLITASPEAMQGKSRGSQDEYFRDAIKWLQEKHGAANVVYAGIHRDETTPHMYAYVVPLVGKKLNCRHFLGGSKALTEMQTDFAVQVGLKHGLRRGLEGSKARHTAIAKFYVRVNEKTSQTPNLDLPAPSLSDRLNPRAYGERTARLAFDLVNPELLGLRAKAQELDLAKQQAAEARAAVKSQDDRLKPIVDVLRSLTPEDRQVLVQIVRTAGEKLLERQKTRVSKRDQTKNQQQPNKGRGR